MLGSKLAGVVFVMSFFNSSKVNPTANFAAILAMGNPVAFEARAEDRLTLGFISIMLNSPLSGLIAN